MQPLLGKASGFERSLVSIWFQRVFVVDDGDEQVRTDSAPFMYPNVRARRLKDQEVWEVRFVDSETRKDLDPESLVSKKLDILRCVLVVDNIFIGPRWKSVQVFVKEAIVKIHEEVSFLDY